MGDGMENAESFAGDSLTKIPYKSFFTDAVSKGYLSAMQIAFYEASSPEKASIIEQLSSLMTVYSLLVYKLYSSSPAFRKEIDSSSELKSNFKSVKEMLDANRGEKLADEFIARVDSIVS